MVRSRDLGWSHRNAVTPSQSDGALALRPPSAADGAFRSTQLRERSSPVGGGVRGLDQNAGDSPRGSWFRSNSGLAKYAHTAVAGTDDVDVLCRPPSPSKFAAVGAVDTGNTSPLRLAPRQHGAPTPHLTSSWGSSILQTSPASRGDFRFRSNAHSEAQATALATLRLFFIERLGGVRQAFDRMDFNLNGRVSCMEFQEVVSGQERYCGMQEARELFCLLAKGTQGFLTFDTFCVRLGETVVDHLGDTSASLASCRSSSSVDSSARPAGDALRDLLFGAKGSGRDHLRRAETETDEGATTVQMLTSRSSAVPSCTNKDITDHSLAPSSGTANQGLGFSGMLEKSSINLADRKSVV